MVQTSGSHKVIKLYCKEDAVELSFCNFLGFSQVNAAEQGLVSWRRMMSYIGDWWFIAISCFHIIQKLTVIDSTHCSLFVKKILSTKHPQVTSTFWWTSVISPWPVQLYLSSTTTGLLVLIQECGGGSTTEVRIRYKNPPIPSQSE